MSLVADDARVFIEPVIRATACATVRHRPVADVEAGATFIVAVRARVSALRHVEILAWLEAPGEPRNKSRRVSFTFALAFPVIASLGFPCVAPRGRWRRRDFVLLPLLLLTVELALRRCP